MGNILQDMMGLLSRKKVVKEVEPTDLIILGRTPNPEDSMFVTPKMNNQLITIKDLKAHFDEGEISGGGTLNTIPVFTPDGTTLGDSQLQQSPQLSNGLYQIRFNNADRFIINKPSSVTTGDPEYLIQQDGNFKVSFGWDDDGDGFGYIYNWAGNGLRLGAAGQNPQFELDTATPKIISHTDHEFEGAILDVNALPGTAGQVLGSTGTGIEWVDNTVTGTVTGSGTTNVLPIWTDGPNSELGDSQVTQTKIDGGVIFDLNAVTTTTYTPAINTKLLDLNSGGNKKFSITQDGGGGVVLPNSGGTTNPGPSFNLGGNALANGENALSVGASTTAFGNGSFAANFITLASGGGSSAFGLLTEASGLASAVFGNKSIASGVYSIASGQDSVASGQSSVAIGEKGEANGKNSFVQGFGGTAAGNNAVKLGYAGSADGNNAVKFGFESIASGNNSFAIGDGTTASGLQSVATGDNNVVSGNNSFVGGKNSTVTGSESIVYGIGNSVSSGSCAVFGAQNTIAINAFESFVAGTNNRTTSTGRQKLIGTGLEGGNQDSVCLGKYNDLNDGFQQFQIGSGSSDINRSNALSINGAGNIKIPTYGSGTVTGTATYNLSVDANGVIIETNTPAGTNYSSAVFLLNQSGASAPVNANLLENSLGIPTPFNWTRVGSGEYNLNAPGKFSLLKTIVFINGGSAENNHDIAWEVIDTDNLAIRTHNSDGKLTKASVEIRTYN